MSNAGRPALFKDPDDLNKKIQDYIDSCEEKKTPLTITGLAYSLGFESRQSFYDYEKNKEFSYIIKRARLLIERSYEIRLSGNNYSGAIFALKNFGWIDKQTTVHELPETSSFSITFRNGDSVDEAAKVQCHEPEAD